MLLQFTMLCECMLLQFTMLFERSLLHFTMLFERMSDDAHKSELAVALHSALLFTTLLQFTMLRERTLMQFTMLLERIDAHKSDISSCSSQCLSIYHVAAIYNVLRTHVSAIYHVI